MSAAGELDTGVIFCDDNLARLARMPTESVDLVYLDPPFFSNQHYEVIWGDETGGRQPESREASRGARQGKGCDRLLRRVVQPSLRPLPPQGRDGPTLDRWNVACKPNETAVRVRGIELWVASREVRLTKKSPRLLSKESKSGAGVLAWWSFVGSAKFCTGVSFSITRPASRSW
jgi:hypothetical protein